MPDPIKRHSALHPISREHHQGLLLAWKIRQGFKVGIEVERIENYIRWFWAKHLKPHFEFEESHIFPLLDSDHPLIAEALEQHRNLISLFCNSKHDQETLSTLEATLVAHIRFEERVLFKEIENTATDEQLDQMARMHTKLEEEPWQDEFWL